MVNRNGTKKVGRPPLQGKEMTTLISVRVPAALKRKAISKAHESGIEFSIVVRQLLEAYITGEVHISLVRQVNNTRPKVRT